jgi:CRP/FNR family cyclic AMP-dependent transcriptional regulator
MATAMQANSFTCPERLVAFLKSHTFFGGLPDATLDALVRKGIVKRFPKGEVIWRRGDPGDSLMAILSGRIKISNTNAEAKEVVLNFLGVGDINGEMAVLGGKERTATATVLEDSEVLVIAGRELIPALIANPEVLLEIIQELCEKLRATSAIIEDSTLAMRGRVARGLLRLAQQHGRTSKDGVRIHLALSQSDLGRYLGLSRPNVSRQLGYLKDANVIRIDGSQVVITDAHGLTEIAESDTTL